MKNYLVFFCILLSMISHASIGNVKKIKDPIYPDLFCNSNEITWQNNKLVTETESALLTCEQSGYVSFVFGEDELNNSEILRIRDFLAVAKQSMAVEQEFDFISMSVIDLMWMLKNIYERRNMSPEFHAKILEAMKKPAAFLLKELDIEKQELEKCDLSSDQTSYRCHVFTIRNRVYESQDKSQNTDSSTKDYSENQSKETKPKK